MAVKAYSFRFSDDVLQHLDFLCGVTDMNRTAFLVSMIEREYDQYQGNPELQKLIAQMTEVKAQMESMMLGK